MALTDTVDCPRSYRYAQPDSHLSQHNRPRNLHEAERVAQAHAAGLQYQTSHPLLSQWNHARPIWKSPGVILIGICSYMWAYTKHLHVRPQENHPDVFRFFCRPTGPRWICIRHIDRCLHHQSELQDSSFRSCWRVRPLNWDTVKTGVSTYWINIIRINRVIR